MNKTSDLLAEAGFPATLHQTRRMKCDSANKIRRKPGQEARSLAPAEKFFPRRFLRNGHLQTLVGNFKPRQYILPEAAAHIIEVDPGKKAGTEGKTYDSADAGRLAEARADVRARGASFVLCHCHWQANPGQHLTMILVHGLEGSSSSQYVLGNAARAWAAGCNVIRMNMRNCGGTEDLSPTLYHSGLSGDVARVMQTLSLEKCLGDFALVGYSMGGNVVLKLAGEMGANAPNRLKAVVGISPAMDLGTSADALHRVVE